MNKRMKSIEDMTHYEVLNISPSSSQQNIEEAYRISRQAFSEDSLAHYGLVEAKQRQEMLKRIEEAFHILGNPRRRKRYDVKVLKLKSEGYEFAYFRNGVERMVIESEEDRPSRKGRLKRFFRRFNPLQRNSS